MSKTNYLHDELNTLVQSDTTTWQFLQEGSLDGVWYWDLEHPDHEWMSPEFWRTFGIDPATKTHDPAEWQDLIFGDDLEVALENFNAHCADPDHPYDQVVRYRHADGSTVWIRCRGLAIRDADGKPVRMLGAHTDITPVKRSEQSAKAGWRAAEAANSELRSFAYSVSHDLKAPANTLNLLLGELGHHLAPQFDAEAQELFDMCTETVDRMQKLVEYILEYTRVIGMDPVFEKVCLNGVVQEALENLRGDIDASGALTEVGDIGSVYAIRPQMTILFQNLISNAIKYSHPDRRPEITITQEPAPGGEALTITVKDNGIGIPEQYQERIFDIFQRLHGQSEIEGVGLGLPLCQHIALNHRGQIFVTSTPELTSAFTVVLPRRPLT